MRDRKGSPALAAIGQLIVSPCGNVPIMDTSEAGRAVAGGNDPVGGKSGLHRAGCRLTAGRREAMESGTENTPPMARSPDFAAARRQSLVVGGQGRKLLDSLRAGSGKGEMVR